jgi:hypothetical protein
MAADLFESETVLQDVMSGEPAYSLAQAGRHYPQQVSSPQAVHRHVREGLRAVRLGAALGPKGMFTTPSAIHRFFLRLSGVESMPVAASARSRRAHERAARELDAIGIC